MDPFQPSTLKAEKYVSMTPEYRIMGGNDDRFPFFFQSVKDLNESPNGVCIDI
jgi:hypothetical protein